VILKRHEACLPQLLSGHEEVAAFIDQLGLRTNTFLDDKLSREGLFNTSVDPKITIPCTLVIKKDGIDTEVHLFNP